MSASTADSAATPVTIIGSYVSPFVRKVLVCLDLKQVPYVIDPITPFSATTGLRRSVRSAACRYSSTTASPCATRP